MKGLLIVKVENTEVYNLEGAVKASKYPMAVDTDKLNGEINSVTRVLGSAKPGTGHDNYLQGILVKFDLTCSNKMWVEFERYHFMDIVSSQSTMHRIAKLADTDCFNEYVTDETKAEVKRLLDIYNKTQDKEDYLRLLYNIPSGIELTAQIVTNYRQLKTMYIQRRDHRLPEWRKFCEEILKLPHFCELTDADH